MENSNRVRRVGEATERKIALLRRANTETATRYGKGGLKTSPAATRKISLAKTPWDDEKQK